MVVLTPELMIMKHSDTDDLVAKAKAAKLASRSLGKTDSKVKNDALLKIASALSFRRAEILEANEIDVNIARQSGMDEALLDRLVLNKQRLESNARDIEVVASLPDPIGESFDQRVLPNGLQVSRRRVPIGVIGAIYESRPNVTLDISALCIKSGNSVILRGGREAIRTNSTLSRIVRDSISEAGVSEECVQFVESTDRSIVDYMLQMKEYIDLMIPRGGADFIKFIGANAKMPVVTGGVGVCHTYVDSRADLNDAVPIVINAKVQRPTVCNALDTLLVHEDVARDYLPRVAVEMDRNGVVLHCDEQSMEILGDLNLPSLSPSTEEDWGKEFLSLTAAVKIVKSLDEALEHIERYGSGHSEAIITEDYRSAMRFLNEVDAAVVYVNASTRFTDGGELGLGAEVAISTNKLHARGPMGLRELTSYKWIILGNGQVRV